MKQDFMLKMKLDKNLLERTVYIILVVNIFISLIASSLILSFKGSENNLVFSFENDPEFAIAVFLSFIIFYPVMFFILYLITFFILMIIKLIKKDGPAEI